MPRRKGDLDRVPRTPKSLWDESFPGVPQNNATAALAIVREKMASIPILLSQPESWDPALRIEVPDVDSYSWKNDNVRLRAPWSLAGDQAATVQRLDGWLNVTLFSDACRGQPFGIVLVPKHRTAKYALFFQPIGSIRAELEVLQRHAFLLAQGALQACVIPDLPTLKALPAVVMPTKRRARGSKSKTRHALAHRALAAIYKIHRNNLAAVTGRSGFKPISWKTVTRRKPHPFSVSADELLLRLCKQTRKQLVGTKEGSRMVEQVRAITEKIAADDGPLVVWGK